MAKNTTTTNQPKDNILKELFADLAGKFERHNVIDPRALLAFLKEAHPQVQDPPVPPPADNAHVAEGAELFPEPDSEQVQATEEEPTL